MILSRVICRDSFYTKTTMHGERRPPERLTRSGVLYDTVVANPGEIRDASGGYLHHREMIIVIDGTQVYPEYLVRYEVDDLDARRKYVCSYLKSATDFGALFGQKKKTPVWEHETEEAENFF